MKLYNDYNSYLKERYGDRVYRIGIDAGFSCPNRDGTAGTLGCAYCNEDGSRASYSNGKDTIEAQLKKRMEYLRTKKGASKFIAYFQAFTNTHADVRKLKAAYDSIAGFKDIVGISIGTRPDAIDEARLALISSYKRDYEVWIEYGLQSSHDRTLKLLRRGHTFKDFARAVKLTKDFDIPVSAHIILGLPGESRDDMIETAVRLNELKISAVKIHLLHILKGSAFEKAYKDGSLKVLEAHEYAGLVCDVLEHLDPGVIIQRLTGEGPREKHIAPLWALDKTRVIDNIRKELMKRGSCQGSALKHAG